MVMMQQYLILYITYYVPGTTISIYVCIILLSPAHNSLGKVLLSYLSFFIDEEAEAHAQGHMAVS